MRRMSNAMRCISYDLKAYTYSRSNQQTTTLLVHTRVFGAYPFALGTYGHALRDYMICDAAQNIMLRTASRYALRCIPAHFAPRACASLPHMHQLVTAYAYVPRAYPYAPRAYGYAPRAYGYALGAYLYDEDGDGGDDGGGGDD